MGLVFLPSTWQSTSWEKLNRKCLFDDLDLKFWKPPGHTRILKPLFWVNELDEKKPSSFHIIPRAFLHPFHVIISMLQVLSNSCPFQGRFTVITKTDFQYCQQARRLGWSTVASHLFVGFSQCRGCCGWIGTSTWDCESAVERVAGQMFILYPSSSSDELKCRSENHDGTDESWRIPSQIQHFSETEPSL